MHRNCRILPSRVSRDWLLELTRRSHPRTTRTRCPVRTRRTGPGLTMRSTKALWNAGHLSPERGKDPQNHHEDGVQE